MMKNNLNLVRVGQVSTLVAMCALSVATGQERVDDNDVMVVTASRLPESELESVSKVVIISPEDRENKQIYRLQDTLNLAPGVISTSTAGQAGQTGTLIMRGLPTRYNQLLIDGVRVSDAVVSGGTMGNLLGNFQLGASEQVEVVNGQHGVVHGNAALGGLVGISNQFSEDSPHGSVSQEIGSYEYTRSAFSSSGTVEDFSYYLNLSNLYEEQDLPSDQAYQVTNRQLSYGLKYDLNETHSLKVTGRGGHSYLDGAFSTFDNTYDLASLHFLTDTGSGYESALVLGYYTEDFDSTDLAFGTFDSDFKKWSLTFDNSLELSDQYTLRAGVDLAWNEYSSEVQFFGEPQESSWKTYSAYLEGVSTWGDLSIDTGVRAEFHSDYDMLPSAHARVKYYVEDLELDSYFKLSTGFRAPSLTETEAFPAGFQLANPDLEEERVVSVELGLEKEIRGHHLAVTGYGHFLTDAIANPSFSQFVNVEGTSEIFGLETALKGEFMDTLNYSFIWNYALKNDVVSLPRNTVNADIQYVTDRWLVGIGMEHQTKASYGSARSLDSRFITRLYGNYAVADWLKISARVENLFNEEYEVDPFAFDYPAYLSSFSINPIQEIGKGTSAYIGVTLDW